MFESFLLDLVTLEWKALCHADFTFSGCVPLYKGACPVANPVGHVAEMLNDNTLLLSGGSLSNKGQGSEVHIHTLSINQMTWKLFKYSCDPPDLHTSYPALYYPQQGIPPSLN